MQSKLPYDVTSQKSILLYAKRLEKKSLSNFFSKEQVKRKDKGSLGKLIEKLYFCYNPNSEAAADFKEASLELKVTPLKKLKNGTYRSKERLVLNIINYLEIANQDFYSSSFWKKNANLLLVFYLYEKEKELFDYLVEFVDIWSFPAYDLEIIKQDWETIRQKVMQGKAEELSEGDTFYLGACTKGSKGGNLREQPFSKILAKQRAFSLKQGYVNHIIATISKEPLKYGKLIRSLDTSISIESVVVQKFERFYGKSVEAIVEKLQLQLNYKAKNFYANLTKAILGIASDEEIEEFEKADIIVKTVRLKENALPKEDLSFSKFDYVKIVHEAWEESEILHLLEHKFFFVFFQYKQEQLILQKVKFWNIPYHDILEVKKVWNRTKELVQKGSIVASIYEDKNGKKIRHTNFPNKDFNAVAHVRPHARDATDASPLPMQDILTKVDKYTKHSFWLNNSYVKNQIYLNEDVS